jgi:DNA-binding SARP family transcriptional activator
MPDLKLHVLGSLHLERDSQSVKVERHMALALLVYLAVTGQPHRRETLAALFWPDYDHVRARAALRRELAALNQALAGEALEVDRETIGLLRPESGVGLWLDADQFHHLLAMCRTHGHPETEVCPACLKPLAEAVVLYQGDFLSGFTLRHSPDFDDWQLFQAEILRRELAGALERLARGYSARQEFEPAIGYARRWLALDPFHEAAHCYLMSLYTWLGQPQAALRQYAECARRLEQELGLSPQAATTQLYQAIKENALAPPGRLYASPLPKEKKYTQPTSVIRRQPQPAYPGQSLALLDRIAAGQLVGREREMAQASALWSRAAFGEGHVLLVSGEAGVGKTRLGREITALAEASAARVLIGRCEAEGSAPYAPIAQIIRAAFDNAPDTGRQPRPELVVGPVAGLPDFILADLLTFAPQLRPRYPQITPNPPLEPQFERQRLFDSFVSWCTIMAGQTPLLLWVEDVHWADSGALSLLHHLAHRVRGMRLLLVMTYRDTEVELAEARTLKEVLLEFNRERLAEPLKLARLSREQTRDLLVALLATGGEITPEFLDSVYRETEGNPFFIEEVCKMLIEEGKLYFAGGYWRRAEIEAMVIPQSIRAAILSRIEKLPLSVQEILRLAAILGREFDFPTLKTMSEWEEEMLLSALEQAERAQLLGEAQRGGDIRFAFAHALIPFTLRESLSGLRLQRLHCRAATVIAAQRPGDVEALAYHFTAAGERDKAIEYTLRAAQHAETLYAYDTATRHLQTALHLLGEEGPNETHLAALEKLGDVHLLNDNRPEAVLAYQEALAVVRPLKLDKLAQIRLLRKIGETVFDTDFFLRVKSFQAAAREGLEEGLRLMANEPPHPETVRLLVNLSFEAWRGRSPQQDWDAAERYAQQAVNIANELESPVELSTALNGLFIVYAARGLYHKRLEVALQRVTLSRQPGFNDLRERVRLLQSASDALMEFGQYTQALAHLQEAETIAHQIHTLGDLCEIFRRQAHCAFCLDRWDEVVLDEKFLALSHRYAPKHPRPNCFHLALMACVNALRGNFERANLLRAESAADMEAAEPSEMWGRGPRY